MHGSIKHSLKSVLVAGALALTSVGAVTPGEARGGGGGHGGGGGGGAFMGGGGGFRGGGFGLDGAGGFHGGGGSYEAHDFGGVGVSHSLRGVHGNHGWHGWYGGGYACDPYLANPQPPYCPDYTY
jgi:hypothetical protein